MICTPPEPKQPPTIPAEVISDLADTIMDWINRNSFTTQERRRIRAVVEGNLREAYVKGYEDSHRKWMEGLKVT